MFRSDPPEGYPVLLSYRSSEILRWSELNGFRSMKIYQFAAI